MAKELIYRVKIVPDEKANQQFAQSVSRGQEQAQEATKDTITEINREIAQLELMAQTGRESAGQISEAIERLNKDLATAPKQTKKVINSQKRLHRLQDRLADSTRNVTNRTGTMRNTISGANQTLFSFGDIINDSAQFQFGFAQGSRAIGNNIAFMAEQFSNVQNRAGSFTGALKAMGSSLLGPGGIILGINLVVTALTLFGDKLFDTEKATESINEDLEQTVSHLESIGSALANVRGIPSGTIGKVQELRIQQERLNQRLQTNQTIIRELGGLTQEEQSRLEELQGIRQEGLSGRQAEITLTEEQQKELRELEARQTSSASTVENYRKENEKLQGRIEELTAEEQNLIRESREVARAQTEASGAVDVFALRAQDSRDKTRELTNATKDYKKIAASMDVGKMPEQPTLTDPIPQGSIAQIESNIQAYKNMQKILDTTTEEGKAGFRELQQAIRDAKNELKDLKNEGGQAGQGVVTAINAIGSAANNLTSSLGQLAQTRADARLEEAKAAGASAERIRQIERERFEAQKKSAVASAIINTALGITNVWAQHAANPVLAGALTGIVTAAGAAQIAAIQAQEFGGGGSAPEAPSRPSEGFSTTDVSDSQQQSPPASRQVGQLRQQQQEPTVIVEANNVLPDTEFSARAERGRKEREKDVTVITSD